MSIAKAVEVILARQLASYLALPIFIVDPDGTLLYYNEKAEAILGYRFDETGAMAASEWGTIFTPYDDQGQPITVEQLPLIIALTNREPARGTFWIKRLDGQRRHIEVMAIPLIGQADRFLGAMAMFWEVQA